MFSKRKGKPDLITRGSRGRFKPGCSANPAGRPKGIVDKRVKLRELINPHAEHLILIAIDRAKHGDMQALKLLLDRTCPTLKPTQDLLQADISGKSASAKAESILNQVVKGRLSTEDAEKLVGLLLSNLKIMELEALEKRLSKIEKSIERGDYDDDET